MPPPPSTRPPRARSGLTRPTTTTAGSASSTHIQSTPSGVSPPLPSTPIAARLLTYAPAVDADANEVTRYLGQNSIPALLKEQSSPNAPKEGVEYIRHDMRSIFGLDNSAPFPLMSARHMDRLTLDIAAELPSDREVMKWVSAGLR